MSDSIQLVGELPDDPRVVAALKKIEESGDGGMTEAITQPPPKGLERYGIKLRMPGLMQSAMLARIMRKKSDIAQEFQMFIYIYTLAAPVKDVYVALDILDSDGFPSFMAIVQEWFEASGIPGQTSPELLAAITETFETVTKLSPSESEDSTEDSQIKKNALRGTSSPPTSS